MQQSRKRRLLLGILLVIGLPVIWLSIKMLLAPAQKERMAGAYSRLPLSFEMNRGQADSQVKYLSRGNGYSLFLTPTKALLEMKSNSQKSSLLQIQFLNANPSPQLEGLDELSAKSNYLIGNDP